MSDAIQKLMIGIFKRLPGGVLVKMAGGKPTQIAGRTLDPMCQLMAVQSASAPPMSSLTPEQAREGMNQSLALAQMPAIPMASTEDRTIPGPGGEIPVRVYTPRGTADGAPLVLYFHMGGCVIGDRETCHPFCTLLADTASAIVVSVDYRLAPEHKFPAATDDAIAAFRWVHEHAAELGADPARIAVGGDSAGGLLSAVITHTMKREEGPMPCHQLLIYPWVDAPGKTPSYTDFADTSPLNKETMEWFEGQYLNDASEADDTRVAPMLEPDFKGLPSATIVTSGFDPLSDEGKLYADKLEIAGVGVTYRCEESLPHAFTALAGAVPAARRACDHIAQDLKKALSV